MSTDNRILFTPIYYFTKDTPKLDMLPKTCLVNWRMQRANTLLETSKTPMIVIAEASGYSSEAAFS